MNTLKKKNSYIYILNHITVSQSRSQNSELQMNAVPIVPIHSPMQGFTWGKQALVRSPSSAKELCLTSGIVSCHTENIKTVGAEQDATGPKKKEKSSLCFAFTCMHWKSRVMMLERATSCSTCSPKPSARPLNRSSATIMKSLSGASYWSGCWLYICFGATR